MGKAFVGFFGGLDAMCAGVEEVKETRGNHTK